MSKRLVIGVICGAILVLVAFALGQSLGQRSMLAAARVHLDSTQAMLAFNRLQDERRWKAMLSKGCLSQLAQALDVSENENEEIISRLANGSIDAEAIKYVESREPGLLNQLKSFKNKYAQGWTEVECKE